MGALLAKGIFSLRRLMAARYALVAAFFGTALISQGFFIGLKFSQEYWSPLAAIILFATLLMLHLGRKAQPRQTRFAERCERFEAGYLLLILVYMAVQASGGPRTWTQPAVYLALAYLASFNHQWIGAALTVAALALQTSLYVALGNLPQAWSSLLIDSTYLVGFSSASMLFLGMEAARQRRDGQQRLEKEIRSLHDEARDYRLGDRTLSSKEKYDRATEEAKVARGSVDAIHQSMFFVLELLKKSLDLQTCVLLWLDHTGQRLQIKEMVSDSAMVKELPFPAQSGALGGVLKNRLLINLRELRDSRRTIPYYEGPEQVGAFIGVPVLEDGNLRGVLCADRRDNRPFSVNEEQVMVEAARQVLRAIQSERIFLAVERSKYEHERFYRASTMLNSALTLSQVWETAFIAAREIAEFDFGAITLLDRKEKKHIICCVYGDERERLEGEGFGDNADGDNAGLVAMVVKNKHPLPASQDLRHREIIVFNKSPKLRLPELGSLIILPLIVQDKAIGTMTLGARQRGRFSKKTQEMLGVIANQVAVSIENAKMYKLMEEMATTDGLTELYNHRTFKGRFAEMLYRAERHRKPLSIVITDIDKFKSVNDTYGHPVGDAVLKRIAQVLKQAARRKVDLVARYGGEEFAMVLEETDTEGARLFCERVRQEVAAQLMSSEQGSFRVTLSLGVATYPQDGNTKEALIKLADQALYTAKKSGRNRTVCCAELSHQQNQALSS